MSLICFVAPRVLKLKMSNFENKKGDLFPDHLSFVRLSLVELVETGLINYAKSNRSRFITLLHAATKSFTNFS